MYQKKVNLKGAKYIFGKCRYCNCPITDLDLRITHRDGVYFIIKSFKKILWGKIEL